MKASTDEIETKNNQQNSYTGMPKVGKATSSSTGVQMRQQLCHGPPTVRTSEYVKIHVLLPCSCAAACAWRFPTANTEQGSNMKDVSGMFFKSGGAIP